MIELYFCIIDIFILAPIKNLDEMDIYFQCKYTNYINLTSFKEDLKKKNPDSKYDCRFTAQKMETFIFQRAYSNFRFKLELVASRLILFSFFLY